MNKKEVLKLIHTIEIYYNNPFTRRRNAFNQDKTDEAVLLDVVEAWYIVLKDCEFLEANERLLEHIKTNKFAPTIADLIKQVERRDRAIPSNQETKALIERWDEDKNQVASDEVVKENLEKMRKILGIG